MGSLGLCALCASQPYLARAAEPPHAPWRGNLEIFAFAEGNQSV